MSARFALKRGTDKITVVGAITGVARRGMRISGVGYRPSHGAPEEGTAADFLRGCLKPDLCRGRFSPSVATRLTAVAVVPEKTAAAFFLIGVADGHSSGFVG